MKGGLSWKEVAGSLSPFFRYLESFTTRLGPRLFPSLLGCERLVYSSLLIAVCDFYFWDLPLYSVPSALSHLTFLGCVCWSLFGFAWMRTTILAGVIAVVRSGWVLVFLFATEDRVVVNVFIVHWRLDY